ncbi:MAG: radical SAM protein [Magnetococcales bacterium]|nr:radical SAM protein [Magnetococcales bacterium]
MIDSLYPDPVEAQRVREILAESERQSQLKEIRVIRQTPPWLKKARIYHKLFKYGLHFSKPLFLVRLARNMILAKIYAILKIDKHILRGCEFCPTFHCNFDCSHCLCKELQERSTRREMDVEDYRRVVKEAMKLGATAFGIEGGEPFVKKNWDKIIEACKPRWNHINITTNGYLFDEPRARRCAELGVTVVAFSIDNGVPELHDLFRRKRDSFARAMKGIELCKRYGIKPIINTVVHKKNLYTDGLLKLLEFAEEEHILLHLIFAKAVGNFKDDRALMLDDDDFKAFRHIIAPYGFAHLHHDTETVHVGKRGGCPGTKEVLNFTPYGDVIHCALMHIYFGNVMEESLASIRERALKQTPFSRFQPCFLTQDKDFMNIYYPAMEGKAHLKIEEFREALIEYETQNQVVLYPEMHKEPQEPMSGSRGA